MDKEAQGKIDDLRYDIEKLLWRHIEVLACGYMGIRCGKNQYSGGNYARISQEIVQRITELGYRKLPKDKVILDKDLAYQIFAQICGIRMREPTDYRSALDDSYDRLKAILQ